MTTEAPINTLVDGWDFFTYRAQHGGRDPERLFFICPWCGREQAQRADNFHYWCVKEEGGCGRNAADFEQ